MKRCPNCGARIEHQGDALCAYCGAQLQESAPPQQKVTYQPQQAAPQQTPLMQKVNKSAEIANKVYLSKILSIVSLVFSSFFVLAVIAIIMASSVIKDPAAAYEQKRSAKNSVIIASVSIVMGIVFYVFASVLAAFMK